MSRLDQYLAEMEKDVKIDELSMRDKAMMIPGIKHKWVSRLIQEKIHLKKLESNRKRLIDDLASQLQASSPVHFSKTVLSEAVSKSTHIQKLNDDIDEAQIAIEYLEKADRIMTGMGYDLKNLIELIKMETM